MQIKRYEVLDKRDAVEMIKKDLGNDAVIISMRQVASSSDPGFFGRPFVEVVAAADNAEGFHSGYNLPAETPLYLSRSPLEGEPIQTDGSSWVISKKFDNILIALNEIKTSLEEIKKPGSSFRGKKRRSR